MNKNPNEPKLLDHEADGIKELDNNLPRWWVWMFYLCILYAVGYLGYYHVFNMGDLQAAEYAKESALGEKIKAEAIGKFESQLGRIGAQHGSRAAGGVRRRSGLRSYWDLRDDGRRRPTPSERGNDEKRGSPAPQKFRPVPVAAELALSLHSVVPLGVACRTWRAIRD